MFPTVDSEDISQVTSQKEKSLTVSRDAQDSPETSEGAKPSNSREISLNMLIKEMIFCIALALTTYGALHNTVTHISKHPQAVRFISSDSVVTDWYKGQLGNALSTINIEDVSFVMYYAPWDAECQYVRSEFEKAALILSDRVHFSAINCWNPGSECKLQHNKIPTWPILMVYTVTSRGILYKGPRDAHSMVKFLGLIMKPLVRVSSTEDLVNLLSACDAVAVGYTPMTETARYYNIWYHTSLKAKEFDVIGEVCFAAVTSEELAMDLGVERFPTVRLMLWNDTKEFVVENNDPHVWNESFLVRWVLENFTQPVARIIPMWRKAFSFERFVDGSPLLMLFTPLNPLYDQLPVYSLMREVAMEYYNCNNNGTYHWTSEITKLQQVQRLLYQQKDFIKLCQEYKFKKPITKQSHFYKKGVVSHNNKYPWNNTTQKHHRSSMFNILIKRGFDISKAIESSHDNFELLSSLGLLEECSTNIFPAERGFYENYEQCQSSEDSFSVEQDLDIEQENVDTSMLPSEDDPLSAENLIQEHMMHFCKLTKFAHEWGPPVLPTKVTGNITHISGLACVANVSLNMIAVDSVRNHHFAEALGIDIHKKSNMTAVVILDTKHETQYVLSEEYNAKTLRDFIYNFTMKKLKRSLRTHVDGAEHTHYYGSDGDVRWERDNKTVEMIELTTRTFRKIVKTPGTVTIVALCAGACGAMTSRAVLEAARLLHGCGVRARPARLDALRHDLPWHYTAHALPALLVFHADSFGEADSRRYPLGARVSASGVVALALRSLSAPHRLRVRLALCRQPQTSTEKKTCLRDIREHISNVISTNLKYWRRTENRELRDALLKRLQHLHQVSLDLSVLHITDLSDADKEHSLLKSFKSLTKNWDIDISILSKNITTLAKTRS